MKTFCVLIPFFYVNVFAVKLAPTNYIEEIVITNIHIQQASNYNHIPGVENVLEHVIESIAYGHEYGIDQLYFMIALPDKVNLTNTQEHIAEHINRQRAMQAEITVKLSIPVPHVEIQNFEDLDLTQLGEDRRLLTGPALKNIIRRALSGYRPNATLSQLCHLIGLMMSTKVGKIFTTTHEIYPNILCILWDRADHYIKYRVFEGQLWQVADDYIDKKLEPLWAQLS
ncbi:uncharacterized protein LOC126836210 [Adelges cooleyi]|uniref:uncharacterized protein LOC126836210 n=1 Tax=Adelges cooleyi TaxID=133065 RepID=UPI00217F6FE7|nr:uncharacterized protein LOC126836210 [Adelges cooleyi]